MADNSSPEALDAFRQETRAWLADNCPEAMRQPVLEDKDHFWGGKNPEYSCDEQRIWFERMAERGWTVPTWPVEYGGAGLSNAQAAILREEMAALGCRNPLSSMGIWMLSPALFKYGTEAQKKKYLPDIAKGRIRWAQGYSEPGAGSDLVSLKCKAEDKGDHWLVNGQKIWTSYANKADWLFVLVRTDPDNRYRGITVVLVDANTPGLTPRPIRLISGASPFCETFFEDVVIPKEQTLGEVNAGWDIAKYILQSERQAIGGLLTKDEEVSLGATISRHLGGIDNPILRAKIAAFDVDAMALSVLTEKFGEDAKAGTAHPSQGSVVKYVGSELGKTRQELLMSAGGYEALDWESLSRGGLADPRVWARSKGYSIEGGTSEIQLNVIAKRMLDLPSA